MDVRFRPLQGTWPQKETPDGERGSRWSFRAGWGDTLHVLEYELEKLKARDIVIAGAWREADIRIDGWPRSNAADPGFPGVIISFESKHGPLKYATDRYAYWQHNVRAIALGLEALRKVDRYGITAKGEQYTGWKALPAGIPMGEAAMSIEQAAAFLIEHGEWGQTSATVDEILEADEQVTAAYFRNAAKKLHPDTGGDPALFRKLQQARELLEAAS
jgi:hypothetical protein